MLKKVLQLRENPFVLNSIITLFLRVLGVLTLFGFTFFLTHNYHEKVVGEYELIRVFLLVLGSIGLLGTEQSILYFAGKYQALNQPWNIKKVYFKMVQLLLFSTVALILVYLLIPRNFILEFYNDDYITYKNIQSCFFVLFFYVLTLLNTEVLRALNYVYISEIFRNTLKFVPVILGSVLLVYLGNPYSIVNYYLYGFIVLAVLTSVMILVDFSKKESVALAENNITLSSVFTTSYPMAVSGLCFFLMLSFDMMLLKKYYSNEYVAYYSIAIKMFTVLSMVIVAVNINVAPKLAEYFSSNKINDLKLLLDKSRKLICLINIPTGLVIVVYGKEILRLFGTNYTQAYVPMVIIVSAQMIASLFGSVATVLNMSNQQQVFKNILLVATLLNLILNFVLVPKYGIIGAATSLAVSLLFWNIFSSFYIKFKILK